MTDIGHHEPNRTRRHGTSAHRTDKNGRRRSTWHRVPDSDHTRLSACSAPAGWARSIVPVIPDCNRLVAIKVLRREYARDRDRLRRFEQEARAAGALNHPNILTLHDVGNVDASPFLVTELLEGNTLREALRHARRPDDRTRSVSSLDMPTAVDYALQIARGLAAAHDAGIVHRDLKPENIFVTRQGQVKILDFGLAKLAPADPMPDHTATASGVVMGTVGYMAPEQVRGQAVDSRADVFAFGAVLYEMLAGRRAFAGASASDTLSAILRDEPPPLTELIPPFHRLSRPSSDAVWPNAPRNDFSPPRI